MSGFADNLISRHTQPAGNVKPRLRGRFEADPRLAGALVGDDSAGPYPGAAPAPRTDPGAPLPPAPWPPAYPVDVSDRDEPPTYGPAPPDLAVGPPPHPSAPDRQPAAGQLSIAQDSNWLSTRVDAAAPPGERPAAPEPLARPARAEPNAADRPGPPARPGGLLGEPARLPDFEKIASSGRAGPGPQAQLPPTIKVTIGRIDVRAVAPPPAAGRPSAGPKPLLSLEEYLAQRATRGRQ